MLAFLILGIILIIVALYNLYLAYLAGNPANLSTTVGTLVKASAYRNVPMRYGGFIRLQTDFAYTYTVDGKIYCRKGRKNQHRRTLPKKVSIVYLTRFPRHNGIERFTPQVEQAMGILLLIEGAILIGMSWLLRFA